MKYELIQTHTGDNLILSGLFSKGDKDKPVVIHLHGYCGDFYTNVFIHKIAEELYRIGVGFVSAQHRGTGCRTELYKYPYGSGGRDIGSFYEKLEEAGLDIDAWIEELQRQGYSRFILQGHSLGTTKVAQYCLSGKYKNLVEKVILLAPFDKDSVLIDAAKEINMTLDEQKLQAQKMIDEGKGDQLSLYGKDDVPHSFANFLSWAMFPEIEDQVEKIAIPLLSVAGDKDEYLRDVRKRLKTILIIDADHGFTGKEEELAKEICYFIGEI